MAFLRHQEPLGSHTWACWHPGYRAGDRACPLQAVLPSSLSVSSSTRLCCSDSHRTSPVMFGHCRLSFLTCMEDKNVTCYTWNGEKQLQHLQNRDQCQKNSLLLRGCTKTGRQWAKRIYKGKQQREAPSWKRRTQRATLNKTIHLVIANWKYKQRLCF